MISAFFTSICSLLAAYFVLVQIKPSLLAVHLQLCYPMSMLTNIQESISQLTVAFIPVLLGIIMHEIAHGWTAARLGDPTAKLMGRLTLNPVPHIDPIGMGMFVFTALFSPFVFGWAKPVPVNPRFFRSMRKGMMIVSAAGPLTNFILAFLFAAAFRMLVFLPESVLDGIIGEYLLKMCRAGVIANFVLAWINLMPLPPLDGGHILEGLLPRSLAQQFQKFARYGFLIFMLLLVSGIFSSILNPLLELSWSAASVIMFWGLF